VSQRPQAGRGERRPTPPPREADDRQVTATITTGWAIALVVLLVLRSELPADVRWWLWTCAIGVLMGLFGLWYVPLLKRKRARMAAERARAVAAAGEEAQLSSGYESRDSGSNTVSSTETPGKSTRS
jgi:Protein of unknown function (DUF2530)